MRGHWNRWLLVAWAIVGLSAAACLPSSPIRPGTLETSGWRFDFGAVQLGQSKQLALELRNPGDEPLKLLGADLLGSSTFTIQDVPTEIAAHGTATAHLVFKPVLREAVTATASIHTGSSETPELTATLTGQGSGTQLEVSTNMLNFGEVLTDSSKMLHVDLINHGQQAEAVRLTFFAAWTSDFEFKLGTEPVVAVAGGATVSVPVIFTAHAEGVAPGAKLRVKPCEGCALAEVDLQGAGVKSLLKVSPSQLDFGSVMAGGKKTLQVTLRNADTEPVTIQSASITNGQTWFSVAPVTTQQLEGGKSLVLDVTYNSDAVAHQGKLAIVTDNARLPTLEVPLSSKGSSSSCIVVTPSAVDFGSAGAGCSSVSRTVTVYNVCQTAPVTVNSLNFGADPARRFSLTSAPIFPQVATPGSPVKFEVRYYPLAVGVDTSEVLINVGGIAEPFHVPLTGRAIETGATQSDTWQQNTPSTADILVVLENSSAMTPYMADLPQNLAKMWDERHHDWTDYHFAVTTTDMSPTGELGRFLPLDQSRPTVVTDTTVNAKDLFLQNGQVGTAGASSAHAIDAVIQAFSPTNLSGPNAGFRRPGVPLVILIVAASPDTSTHSVSDLIAALPAAPWVSVSAAVPGAKTGTTYADLAYQTGGDLFDLTDPMWFPEFSYFEPNRQKNAFGMTKPTADPNTIRVWVDGVELPSIMMDGTPVWSYDAKRVQIIFEPDFVPAAGASIRADYGVACIAP